MKNIRFFFFFFVVVVVVVVFLSENFQLFGDEIFYIFE